MAPFESNQGLQRMSSSLISRGSDQPLRSYSREHSSLMSWPEHAYQVRQKQHQNKEVSDQQEKDLPTRAMQLSIYGSTMDNMQMRRPPSFPSTSKPKPSHSVSYPTIPSSQVRTLVAAKSESSTTMRNNAQVHKQQEKEEVEKPATQNQIGLNLRESHVIDDSSDEEELIIRIDSPSSLSFHQAP